MKERYYHKKRALHLLVSSFCLLLALLLLDTSISLKISFFVTGAGLGYWLGKFGWEKIKARIDNRNIVILYHTDSGFYGVMLFLLFAHLSPFAMSNFLNFVKKYPFVLSYLIGVVAPCWVAYNLVIWRQVKMFENTHGKLTTRKFWSRSLVGQEGMISKEGIVTETCAPQGKVQIGSEIWNAFSIDGTEIKATDRVIVRDIEGLKLIVEKVANG